MTTWWIGLALLVLASLALGHVAVSRKEPRRPETLTSEGLDPNSIL
jgi:hypothetical protein